MFRPLEEVGDELNLQDGQPETPYHRDPADKFEVSAVLLEVTESNARRRARFDRKIKRQVRAYSVYAPQRFEVAGI